MDREYLVGLLIVVIIGLLIFGCICECNIERGVYNKTYSTNYSYWEWVFGKTVILETTKISQQKLKLSTE